MECFGTTLERFIANNDPKCQSMGFDNDLEEVASDGLDAQSPVRKRSQVEQEWNGEVEPTIVPSCWAWAMEREDSPWNQHIKLNEALGFEIESWFEDSLSKDPQRESVIE